MARGWESKAIEDQQAEAAQRTAQADFKPLAPNELALRERLESLRLSQSQLREQLTRARTDAQRQRLNQSLQQLEDELARSLSRANKE